MKDYRDAEAAWQRARALAWHGAAGKAADLVVEGLHARLAPGLQHAGQLVGLGLADEVSDRGVVDEHLQRQGPALAIGPMITFSSSWVYPKVRWRRAIDASV